MILSGGAMKYRFSHSIEVTLLLFSLLSADNEKILFFKDASPYDGHTAAIKVGVAMVNPMTAGIPHTFTNSRQVRCNTLFFSDTYKEFTVLIKAVGPL
jgi:hypothetical protein